MMIIIYIYIYKPHRSALFLFLRWGTLHRPSSILFYNWFKIDKDLVTNYQMNLHANVVTVTHQVSSSVTFTNPLFSAVFFIFYIVFSLMIISDPQKSPFCFWVKNTQRLPSVLLATLFMTKALLLFYYVEVYKKLNKKDPTQTHTNRHALILLGRISI